eukprot:TRINITY_DN18624_c0_g1_i1.p1 TRINITY_DN18624_c0_g1~~TRINITY_DN18624_c0_g1_i1.p1  ORF type:complete len:423 (-),score=70.33 TRINITY_DN18624_c0_g1_i1:155-1423(-)
MSSLADLDALLNDLETTTRPTPTSPQSQNLDTSIQGRLSKRISRRVPSTKAGGIVYNPDNQNATGLQMFDNLIADLNTVNTQPNPNTKELDELDSILNDMSFEDKNPSPQYNSNPAPKQTYNPSGNSNSSYMPPAQNNNSTYRPAGPAASNNPGGAGRGHNPYVSQPGMNNQYKPPVAGSMASKGTCHTCAQPIYNNVMQALGKLYHVACFNCGNCGENIGQKQFFKVEGDPNCEKCYQNLFLTKCAHCDKPIAGACIDAIGKKWHAPCFVCTQCLTPFGTGLFYERDGMPFCEGCFQGMFSNRCGDCGQPVFGECINACGKAWHPDHFVCTTCRKAFGNNPFFEKEGKPYCQVHFYNQQGMTCACGCGRTIMGRAISAANKNWIPEHFTCAFCMNSLGGQKYTEKENRCYCDFCYNKLFGK